MLKINDIIVECDKCETSATYSPSSVNFIPGYIIAVSPRNAVKSASRNGWNLIYNSDEKNYVVTCPNCNGS